MSTFKPDIIFTTKSDKAPKVSREAMEKEAKFLGVTLEELQNEQYGSTAEQEHVRDNTGLTVKTVAPEDQTTQPEIHDSLRRFFIDHPEKERFFKMWAKAGALNHNKFNILDHFTHMMNAYFNTLVHVYPEKGVELEKLQKRVLTIREDLEDLMPEDKRKNEFLVACLSGYLVSIL